MTFRVQKKACATCIYRKDSSLSIVKLENDVRDGYGGFKGHRICHHSKDVCCRGFWNRHRDKFAAGQIAQRLGLVEFVNVDNLREKHHPHKTVAPKARAARVRQASTGSGADAAGDGRSTGTQPDQLRPPDRGGVAGHKRRAR